MTELEALRWMMKQPDILMHVCNLKVVIRTPKYIVSGNNMLDCIVKMKRLLGE